MNYNTDLSLWDSPACRKAYPLVWISADGTVCAKGDAVARFDSRGAAQTTLRKAGWHFDRAHIGTVDKHAEAA